MHEDHPKSIILHVALAYAKKRGYFLTEYFPAIFYFDIVPLILMSIREMECIHQYLAMAMAIH